MKNNSRFLLICFSIALTVLGAIFLVHIKKELLKESSRVTEIYSEEDYAELIESTYAECKVLDDTEEDYSCVYEGVYVNLYTDIDYAKVQSLIGGDLNPEIKKFGGIFDGNGHKIYNLNINSEDRSCLFYKLYGVVANLLIDDSCMYKGYDCEMISCYAQNSAKIINCAGFAQIESDNEDLLYKGEPYIGYNNINTSDIEGKSSTDIEKLVNQLNENALNIDESYCAEFLNKWEIIDGRPTLCEEKLPRAEFAYNDPLSERCYKAFYSDVEKEWILVLPEYLKGGKQDIDVSIFTPHKTSSTVLHMSDNETETVEFEEYSYKVSLKYPNECDVLYVDTTKGDELMNYLHQDKMHIVDGCAYLMSEKGKSTAAYFDEFGGRGNTSWEQEKKGYNIKFSDNVSLVEGEYCREYALIAAQKDNSLLTYVYNGELNKKLDWDNVPSAELMHLYVDGIYYGVYYVTPKIEIAKQRFDLVNLEEKTKVLNHRELFEYECVYEEYPDFESCNLFYKIPNEPEDITGGYIIELNDRWQYADDASRFVTDEGATYVIRSMHYAGENEVRYIRDYWQQFENAIKSPSGVNDEGKNYSEYIDLDSVCRQFLQFELYSEISLKASIYFYKDSDTNGDGKIHAVYPWDVEHSMCQEGFGIYGENAEQNMHHWENIKNRPELRNAMGQIWSKDMKPVVVDFFGTPAQSDDSDAAQLFEKYSDDLKINNYRWQEDDAEVKYEKIMSFMTNRMKYMDDTFAVY